jgi:hypothetical protein
MRSTARQSVDLQPALLLSEGILEPERLEPGRRIESGHWERQRLEAAIALQLSGAIPRMGDTG